MVRASAGQSLIGARGLHGEKREVEQREHDRNSEVVQ
jgi:hypothetical protein